MNAPAIQWPSAKYWDRPWNPVIGCAPASPACEHCYASAWARRFHRSFAPAATRDTEPPRSGVVFAGNMTDLFGEWVPVRFCHSLFSKLWHFPTRHSGPVPNDATYLFLTKRPARMADALRNYTAMPHAWFGMTAENQEWYDRRLPDFREIPARFNGWLSAEPLLGPLDLGLAYIAPEDLPFRWVVVGCESGPARRPCKIEWVESIVAQCLSARVPVFVKQLDLGAVCERDISKFPEHLRIRQVPWAEGKGAGR